MLDLFSRKFSGDGTYYGATTAGTCSYGAMPSDAWPVSVDVLVALNAPQVRAGDGDDSLSISLSVSPPPTFNLGCQLRVHIPMTHHHIHGLGCADIHHVQDSEQVGSFVLLAGFLENR